MISLKQSKKSTPSRLIKMLGDKSHPKFKIKSNSPEQENQIVEQCKATDPEINISSNGFSLRSPDVNKTPRATGENGTPYETVLETQTSTLFVAVTPQTTEQGIQARRLSFDEYSPNKKVKMAQKNPNLYEKPDELEYTVSSSALKCNSSRKRVRSQQQVMGDSAENILKKLGATTQKKQGHGSHYHWTHRRAHSVGGSQTSDNLDPATAAANYQQLFDFDDPINRLVSQKKIDNVTVNGKVVPDSQTGLAEFIQYKANFLNKQLFIQKTVDLRSNRMPTVDENTAANIVIESDIEMHLHAQFL